MCVFQECPCLVDKEFLASLQSVSVTLLSSLLRHNISEGEEVQSGDRLVHDCSTWWAENVLYINNCKILQIQYTQCLLLQGICRFLQYLKIFYIRYPNLFKILKSIKMNHPSSHLIIIIIIVFIVKLFRPLAPYLTLLFPLLSVVAVNMAGGTVPCSIAQSMEVCRPGAPGAPAHCPVEVWDWRLAPGAAHSLPGATEGEIARGHARKLRTARPLNAKVQGLV